MGSSAFAARKLRDWDENGQPSTFGEERIGPLGIIFSMLLVAGAVFILDYGVLPPAYQEGVKPAADVAARLTFRYSDPRELQRQRDEAAEIATRVYTEERGWSDKILRDLREVVEIAAKAQNPRQAVDSAARMPLVDPRIVQELHKYLWDRRSTTEARTVGGTAMLERTAYSLNVIAQNGVLSSTDHNFERNKRGEHREISRVINGKRVRITVDRLRNVSMAADEFRSSAGWKENLPPDLERLILDHITARFTPNLAVEVPLTETNRDAAREEIKDLQVTQNEIILRHNDPVYRADLEKLHAEHRAYKISLPLEARARHIVGLTCLTVAVLIIFLLVVNRMQRSVFRRRRALIMLGLFTLGTLAFSRGLMLYDLSLALAPFVFLGMVASLAFGQTIAALTLFGLCILATLAGIRWEAFPLEGGVPAMAVAMMAGGVTAALPAERLRDRYDLLKFGFAAGIVQMILVLGLSCLGEGTTPGGLITSALDRFVTRSGVPSPADAFFAFIMGPGWAFIVLGSLPLLESLFGILTNIRLAELADTNHPALQRIQQIAGGTWLHTLGVRFLAEPAARAIGANERLITVGVLYHDLGKVLKPEYFVENQMGAEELHKRLRPSISTLTITAHVKDGIELAQEEYRLPQQIIDFIPQHHGTTLVSYFYHSAKKDAKATDLANAEGNATEVQESFFRYPGPKPQSREAAIVMMADTVEAATRTLEHPSAARLQLFVHNLMMDKMLDGQLDECDLTFAELALIEEAFLRVLVAKFHSRVMYPDQDPERTAAVSNKTTIMEVPGVGSGRGGSSSSRPERVSLQKPAAEPKRAEAPGGSVAPPPTTTLSPAPIPAREILTETRMLGRASDRKN